MNLLRKSFSPKKESPTDSVCEMENCVCCGAKTTVPVSAPIEIRHNFVSGCGQLCPRCYSMLCESYDENLQTANYTINKSEKR